MDELQLVGELVRCIGTRLFQSDHLEFGDKGDVASLVHE